MHILIIAEAGVNHNGSIDIAKQLIDKAVEAGADNPPVVVGASADNPLAAVGVDGL